MVQMPSSRTSTAVQVEPRYLSTVQAAIYTGIGKGTLEKLRVSGGGPPFCKVTKKVVYDCAALDAWLARHERRSTSEMTAPTAERRKASAKT